MPPQILAEQADRRTQNLTWLGLGLMSVQFGILARLTWWEYSWDIMEPGKKDFFIVLVRGRVPGKGSNLNISSIIGDNTLIFRHEIVIRTSNMCVIDNKLSYRHAVRGT